MRGGQSGRLRAVSMSHALTWLMSAYLGIGVVLLHVGPLHRLIVDAMQEARMRRAMQPPHEPPLPPPLLSALLGEHLGWAGWGGAAMIVTALVFSQSQPAPRVVIKAQ